MLDSIFSVCEAIIHFSTLTNNILFLVYLVHKFSINIFGHLQDFFHLV